jgi:predicted amidohydrolase
MKYDYSGRNTPTLPENRVILNSWLSSSPRQRQRYFLQALPKDSVFDLFLLGLTNEYMERNVVTNYPEITLAVIQAAPVYLDRDASTEKACQLIEEAAQKGADLVAFSETWLPGYPFFQGQSGSMWNRVVADYLASAVEIPSPTTERLCQAARKAGIDVVIGVSERDSRTRGTVYCTLLFIGREGRIIGRHRKLKPTGTERTVWGEGDGASLRVYQRSYGRISGLNCYEHIMLLPGYALMAQGTQIHIATWPSSNVLSESEFKGLLLSRAFAVQGGCYVMVPCALLRPDDVPESYRDIVSDWWNKGESGSCIINPKGDVIAEAPVGEEMILTSTIKLDIVAHAKSIVDVGGHYSRPDVLQLHLHGQPVHLTDVEAVNEAIAARNSSVPKRIKTENTQPEVVTETS